MIETINGKAYVKKGNKVYEVGGGSNIITADSVEQLPDPASVPEGTIALVKSEGAGGGGLPVVELATELFEGAGSIRDEKDIAQMANVGNSPFVLKVNVRTTTVETMPISVIMYAMGSTEYPGVFQYVTTVFVNNLGRVDIAILYAISEVSFSLLVAPQ